MAKARAKHRNGRHRFDDSDPVAQVVPFGSGRSKRRSAENTPSNVQKKVEAISVAQGYYYLKLKSKQVTFGLGPAGTGKTHIAVGLACEMLAAKEIEQIVITRPLVGVGKTMGFLKGTMEEKFEPFLKPVRDILDQFLGKNQVDCLIRNGKIQVVPLEFIRGTTFNRAFMILDEAQNTTKEEMLAFLTRMGQHSKVAINGDIEQCDLKEESGMVDALRRFEGSSSFGVFEFGIEDIVRGELIKEIILAYREK